MAVVALHHLQLAMPPQGEARAEAFYAGVLGFRRVDKPAHLARRGGAWFEAGTVHLHLGVEADFRPAAKAHPAFVVDDLAAQIRALDIAGHAVARDTQIDGYTRCYTADPFGNRIELMQPMPEMEAR